MKLKTSFYTKYKIYIYNLQNIKFIFHIYKRILYNINMTHINITIKNKTIMS